MLHDDQGQNGEEGQESQHNADNDGAPAFEQNSQWLLHASTGWSYLMPDFLDPTSVWLPGAAVGMVHACTTGPLLPVQLRTGVYVTRLTTHNERSAKR